MSAALTYYLIALRAWYDRQRQARMRGKDFSEPMPIKPGDRT